MSHPAPTVGIIVNPASGRVQGKMSYVMKVDDVYIGCGVYKTLA